MHAVRNVFLLVFVRFPAALIILLAIFAGQCLIRLGHGAVHSAESLANFLDRYCPIRFDSVDRYWARRDAEERAARLAQLNERNQVKGGSR